MNVRHIQTGRPFHFRDDDASRVYESRGNGWYSSFHGYDGGPWYDEGLKEVVPAHGRDLDEIVARYPRVLRTLRWVAILSQGEAAAAIRDYRDGLAYSGEAVNHFGGTRELMARLGDPRVRQAARRAYGLTVSV